MKHWLSRWALMILVPVLLCAAANPHQKSNEVPFPWGSEIPFPWSDIEGVWEANYDGDVTFYSFRVVTRPTDGNTVLQVLIFNPETQEIYGRGSGITAWNERIVDALVDRDGSTHRLLIRAYEKTSSHIRQTFTVITDRALEDGAEDHHSILARISDVPIRDGHVRKKSSVH